MTEEQTLEQLHLLQGELGRQGLDMDFNSDLDTIFIGGRKMGIQESLFDFESTFHNRVHLENSIDNRAKLSLIVQKYFPKAQEYNYSVYSKYECLSEISYFIAA